MSQTGDSQSDLDTMFKSLHDETSLIRRCSRCGTRFTNHIGPTCSECGGALEPIPEANRPCVLLAADAPLDQEKFSALLRQLGCRVEVAENGNVALNKLEELTPDLIVLDLLMPNKGGIETLKILRADQRFFKTPIVMLTNKNDLRMIQAALRGGPTDYLLKSSDPEQIKERFRKYLNL